MMYGPSLWTKPGKQTKRRFMRWLLERCRPCDRKGLPGPFSRSCKNPDSYPGFRVGARVAAVGLGVSLVGFTLEAAANPLLSDAQTNQVNLKDWTSYDKATSMSDGTELHQYVAEANPTLVQGEPVTITLSDDKSEKVKPPVIRFSFIPRFGCTPIISIVTKLLSTDTDEVQERMNNLLEGIEFSVDGTTISFPTLVENEAGVFAAHYDTELRRRNTFRILIEVGATARIKLGELGEFNYSLSGSKRTIDRSMTRCESHAI